MKNQRSNYVDIKYICLLITIFVSQLLSAADGDSIILPKPVNRATMLGIGGASLYDTYLSPLQYNGTSYRIFHEQMNRTSWFNNKFIKQQTVSFEYAKGDNPAKNASQHWFLADYRLGGHYTLVQMGDFRLRVGGLWNISGGVLYSDRNGNNPASARAYTNLNLSALALYNWKIFTFRWQIDMPFVGVLFSPNFGQSYYEMSLGNTVGVVNFASLHNQRSLRNYVTVDFPLSRFTLRAGYLGSYYQTKVNYLQTHTYTHSFVLGFVTESINISGASSRKIPNWESSYY